MVTNVKDLIIGFFVNGHERTLKAKKNILLAFIAKAGSILIGLVLIPITIQYVSPTQYGIWLTISSIINWLNFFDVGLANGLRNKLAHSLAIGEIKKAKIYVGTTYVVLALIAISIYVLFLLINPFINWNSILNVAPLIENDLSLAIHILVGCVCIQFVLQTVNVILTATHQSGKVSVVNLINQIIILLIITCCINIKPGNLVTLVSIVAGVPTGVMLLANLYFFKTILRRVFPIFNIKNLSHAKELLNRGSIFFLIQIGALILFQTDNIIISRLLGPEQVTTFGVSYKLFSVIVMTFSIIMTPIWSSFTDAYSKNDFLWLRSTTYKMRKLWIYFAAATLVILLSSSYIYEFWLGKKIYVPVLLSISMAVYVMAQTWQMLHVYMLNGIGKIRLQLILVTFSSIFNIPLAIFLGKKLGLAGIISANTIFFIVMGIIFFVQCEKIVHQRATNIWDK